MTHDACFILASTGVTIGVDGKATVVGAVTLFSKKFKVPKFCAVSLFLQGTGTGAGGSWKILAANDYDSTRPVQQPGTFVDVTASFGGAANRPAST